MAVENLVFYARIYDYDYDYDYWQNAEDLILFKAAAKDFQQLKLISNGLPFPLTQDVVDISFNPGRSILKMGYIENVGSIMWLGNNFIERFGLNKQNLLSVNWLKCLEIPNCIKIIAFSKPFICDFGIEKDMQEKLRKLIFIF